MRQTVTEKQLSMSVPTVLREWLPPAVLEGLSCVKGCWEELQLRAGRACSVTVGGENRRLDIRLASEDLEQLVMRMCGGSLYAFRDSIVKGYLSPGGGIRVGICGRAAREDGQQLLGLQAVDTLCIRLPHRPIGVGQGVFGRIASFFPQGTLIYAPPGVGKTTLLRALAAHFASGGTPLRVAVVDTREELDDGLFDRALCLSVLSGYPKGLGIEIAARTMNAQLILCDEIGDEEDARGILAAANVGVPVIASAHGARLAHLLRRPAIAALHRSAVFGGYVGIRRGGVGVDYQYEITPYEGVEDRVCQ